MVQPDAGGERSRAGAIALVVEDNAVMRALIRGLVEEAGAAVRECASGEAAVEAYPGLRPDWVLMDLELGGMDGIAAARAIRRMDAGAVIVIVTEYDGVRYRAAAVDAGACGYLLKRDLLDLPGLLAGLPRPP